MARRKPLYTLTEEDVAIFDKARTDGREFTSFYLREPAEESGWVFDENIDPAWQLLFHHAKQNSIVVIGGMGSSKTSGVAVSALVWATTTPDFKFLCVAPTSNQANQMYSFLVTTMGGTLFEERFIAREPTGGNTPKIFIDYKLPDGRKVSSIMEFLSAADDAVRIKNYEGDMVVLDQAEMMDNLVDTISKLGTRVRGKVKKRFRLGRLVLIANAEDNPELWYQADLAEEYPDTNLTILVSTYSNKNVSAEQLLDFERRLGNDPAAIDQHLKGLRPMGAGIEFSASLVKEMLNDVLDSIMLERVEHEDPQFIYRKDDTKKADVVQWEMPPEKDRVYYVCGDPGTGHPPGRNSPVVRVWDVTNYPQAPAVLRAFWWGNGGGKYDAFLSQFKYYIEYYHAMLGAYDATSGQKVLSETSFLTLPNVVPIDMGGIKKKSYIMLLKLMMQSHRIQTPAKIKGQNYQYSKYHLPDDKLSQDIVSCDLVFAGLMRAIGFDEKTPLDDKKEKAVLRDTPTRYDRLGDDRYEREDSREA